MNLELVSRNEELLKKVIKRYVDTLSNFSVQELDDIEKKSIKELRQKYIDSKQQEGYVTYKSLKNIVNNIIFDTKNEYINQIFENDNFKIYNWDSYLIDNNNSKVDILLNKVSILEKKYNSLKRETEQAKKELIDAEKELTDYLINYKSKKHSQKKSNKNRKK